jgi:hypothetical protein
VQFVSSITRFFDSVAGKVLLAVIIICAAIFSYYQFRGVFGLNAGAAASNDRVFICSETGKSFHVLLTADTKIPSYSPFSGKNTGYPAELCYWTADGKIKDTPTPVLLNSRIGVQGPTFCPDCGRLVVGHNPYPQAGRNPPPTKEQYLASGRN